MATNEMSLGWYFLPLFDFAGNGTLVGEASLEKEGLIGGPKRDRAVTGLTSAADTRLWSWTKVVFGESMAAPTAIRAHLNQLHL